MELETSPDTPTVGKESIESEFADEQVSKQLNSNHQLQFQCTLTLSLNVYLRFSNFHSKLKAYPFGVGFNLKHRISKGERTGRRRELVANLNTVMLQRGY